MDIYSRNHVSCEMCGKDIPKAASFTVKIDRSVLTLCPQCYAHYSTRNIKTIQYKQYGKPYNNIAQHTPNRSIQSRYSRDTTYTSRTSRKTGKKHGSVLTAKDVAIYDIIDNYSETVKKAREKLGLSIRDLAQKVRESENVIRRIELGKLKPPLDLARRLEDVLKVKLIVKNIDDETDLSTSASISEITLGDIVNVKMKNKK